MKKVIIMAIGLLLFGIIACGDGKVVTVEVSLPTIQCGMCENTIEQGFGKIKGVVKMDVDLEKKVGYVTYKDWVIDLARIEKAIAELGYKANNTPADPMVYNKLANCCKLPEDQK